MSKGGRTTVKRIRIVVCLALCVIVGSLAGCGTAATPTTAAKTAAAPTAAVPTAAPTTKPAEPTKAPTAAAAAATATVAAPTGPAIKIGLTSGISGANAALTEAVIRGTQLAIKKINAKGGLLGRPVELVTRDDKTQPAEAARNAEELIANDKVVMMYSGGSVAVLQAVQEGTKRAGVMFIANGQGNTFNQADTRGPYDFHMALSPWQNDHVLVPWVLNNLGKKVFMMYYDMAFGTDHFAAVNDAMAKASASLVGSIKYPFGTTDYSSIIPQIRAAQPEVLLCVVSGSDRAAFLKQAASFGLMKEMKIVNVIATTAWDVLSGYQYNEGEYAVSHFDWTLRDSLPSAKEFVDDFFKDYAIVPDGYALYNYQATLVWADGVRKAGSTDPAKVSAAMEGMTFDYGAGPAYIRKCDHKLFLTMYIVKGRSEAASKSVQPYPQWAYREIVATIAPDESYERTCVQLGYK
jgi:branched-chain amino acid transport system substrate-binding protein